MPPAVGAQSLNHWTAREVPFITFQEINLYSFFSVLGFNVDIRCLDIMWLDCDRQNPQKPKLFEILSGV